MQQAGATVDQLDRRFGLAELAVRLRNERDTCVPCDALAWLLDQVEGGLVRPSVGWPSSRPLGT